MNKTAKALEILEAKLREKKILEHEDETLIDEITQDGVDALIEAMQEFSAQELAAFKERLKKDFQTKGNYLNDVITLKKALELIEDGK